MADTLSGIPIRQFKFIETMIEIMLPNDAKGAIALDAALQTGFRSGVCAVLCVTRNSRPDEAYGVTRLSTKGGKATAEDVHCLNKLIRRLKHSMTQSLMFPTFPCRITACRLMLLTDANFAREAGHASQGGFMILLVEDKCTTEAPRRCALIT